jgi:hypothetical protein
LFKLRGKRLLETGSKEADDSCNTDSNKFNHPTVPKSIKRKNQTNLLTFAQFAKRKSEERSHFQAKKGASATKFSKVTINIGVMEYAQNGEPKPIRGSSLPLKIADNSKYDEVRTAALKKREAFDKRFEMERGYVLPYPDTRMAKKYLDQRMNLF